MTCQFLETYIVLYLQLQASWTENLCLDAEDSMHDTQNGDAQCANKRPCFVHAWHDGWLAEIFNNNIPWARAMNQ